MNDRSSSPTDTCPLAAEFIRAAEEVRLTGA